MKAITKVILIFTVLIINSNFAMQKAADRTDPLSPTEAEFHKFRQEIQERKEAQQKQVKRKRIKKFLCCCCPCYQPEEPITR